MHQRRLLTRSDTRWLPFDRGVCAQRAKSNELATFCLCCFCGACERERTVVHACWKRGNPGFVQKGVRSVCVCNYGYVVRRLHCAHENPCLCVRLVCESVFVCGLHMLTITSPICVNRRRRRNRVRHSDYDLKDIRGEGEPVTGPVSWPRCQTNFTHTSLSRFARASHWLSCAQYYTLPALTFS